MALNQVLLATEDPTLFVSSCTLVLWNTSISFPPLHSSRIYCEMYTCDSPLSVWGWKLKQLSLTESSLSSRRFGATLEIPWTIPVFLILFVHMSIFIQIDDRCRDIR